MERRGRKKKQSYWNRRKTWKRRGKTTFWNMFFLLLLFSLQRYEVCRDIYSDNTAVYCRHSFYFSFLFSFFIIFQSFNWILRNFISFYYVHLLLFLHVYIHSSSRIKNNLYKQFVFFFFILFSRKTQLASEQSSMYNIIYILNTFQMFATFAVLKFTLLLMRWHLYTI